MQNRFLEWNVSNFRENVRNIFGLVWSNIPIFDQKCPNTFVKRCMHIRHLTIKHQWLDKEKIPNGIQILCMSRTGGIYSWSCTTPPKPRRTKPISFGYFSTWICYMELGNTPLNSWIPLPSFFPIHSVELSIRCFLFIVVWLEMEINGHVCDNLRRCTASLGIQSGPHSLSDTYVEICIWQLNFFLYCPKVTFIYNK